LDRTIFNLPISEPVEQPFKLDNPQFDRPGEECRALFDRPVKEDSVQFDRQVKEDFVQFDRQVKEDFVQSDRHGNEYHEPYEKSKSQFKVARKRGRKKGYRSENTNREGTVCGICGDQAGRHSYYGGISCPSCRAFFRRSVQGGNYNNFSCCGSRSCSLQHSSRKKCKFCRFQACIHSGMRVSYVLSRKGRKEEEEEDKECDISDHLGDSAYQLDQVCVAETSTFNTFTRETAEQVSRLWWSVFCNLPELPPICTSEEHVNTFLKTRRYDSKTED